MQRIARRSQIIQVDGTFRVCPQPFYQLYTVHCWHLSRKLGQFLETKLQNPAIFIMDMELAMRNTIQDFFQNSRIVFCFFHFCQSHWGKIQSLGLSNDYGDDIELSRKFRMFSALAFVPENFVIPSFENLIDLTSGDQWLDEFIAYLELQFIGRMNSDHQRSNP